MGETFLAAEDRVDDIKEFEQVVGEGVHIVVTHVDELLGDLGGSQFLSKVLPNVFVAGDGRVTNFDIGHA